MSLAQVDLATPLAINGIRLSLHSGTMALRRLACGNRVWLDNGSDGAALWQLHAVDAMGRRVDVDGAAARSVTARSDGEGVRLDWLGVKDRASGAGPFDVRVTIHPFGERPGLTAWRLQVRNRSRRWTLWSARFPRLNGLTASRDPQQDRLFYPDYFPAKRGFKQLVADLKAGGVLVMPYINGRLWDHSAPSYSAEAERHAIKCCAERADPPLRFAWPEAYGNGQLLVTMCMSSTFWRARVVETCRRIVQELGCGGVYLDQLGCSGGMTCVDPEHGHPLGAGAFWLQGMRALLADIRAAIGPEPFLTTENNWEACVADFDALLDTKWNHEDNIPLFPAVYGGLGTIYGGNLSSAACAEGGELFVQRAGMRFVWGGVSGWGQFEALLKQENRPLLDYFKALLALRKAYGHCFDRGRMLRPPEVVPVGTTGPCWNPLKGPVLASMWANPDVPGQAVVFLVNVTRNELRVRVRITDPHWQRSLIATQEGVASAPNGCMATLAPLAAVAVQVTAQAIHR